MAELATTCTSEAPKQPTKSEICQSLLVHDATDFFKGKPVVDTPHAAVLIPLFFKDEQLYVLLTVRSKNLRTHGGEVSFPGGKKDEEDHNIVETALREAEEEIGLPREQVEVISRVVPSIAKYGLVVTPVVGFINKDFVPKLNPDEVEYAFSVPLADFLSSKNHTCQHLDWQGRLFIMQKFSHPHPDPAKPDEKIVTFGLTAHIAMVVASMIYKRPPEFEVDAGFIWDKPTKAAEATYFRHLKHIGYHDKSDESKL